MLMKSENLETTGVVLILLDPEIMGYLFNLGRNPATAARDYRKATL